MPGISIDVWGSTAAADACKDANYTVVYRAVDQASLDQMFDKDGNLDNIDMLLTPPSSDFGRGTSMFIFTPNVHLAEYHARYAKLRAGVHSVVIVAVRIASSAIESLPDSYTRDFHWPSPEWKQIVHSDRCHYVKLPFVRDYKDNAMVVFGSIARKPKAALRRLECPDQMTEEFVVRMGPDGRPGSGPPAIQVVFNLDWKDPEDPDEYENARQWLEDNTSGGRDIRAYPYPQAELDSYLVGGIPSKL
ncbi:hypothetical protein V8F06_009657 [Rhypophila decipiens]